MGRGSSGKSSNSFSKALGKKGPPFTIFESYAGANSQNYHKGKEYRENCQRCVFAYEMRRRGYEVEALPTFPGDTMPYQNASDGWPKVLEGAKLIGMPSRGTVEKLAAQMRQWGDGARAVVKVVWKGGRKGHVFVAEQENGVTRFYDPQPGRPIDIKDYMDHAIKGRTQIMRMDNLKPTSLIEKCVKPIQR